MAAMRWSCTLSGDCVMNPDGKYETQEECLANCAPSDAKDIDIEIYSYNPESALKLPENVRVEVIHRITGCRVPGSVSKKILRTLEKEDVDQLATVPELFPYLKKKYDEEIYVEILLGVNSLEGYQELERLGQFGDYLNNSQKLIEALASNEKTANPAIKKVKRMFNRDGKIDIRVYRWLYSLGCSGALPGNHFNEEAWADWATTAPYHMNVGKLLNAGKVMPTFFENSYIIVALLEKKLIEHKELLKLLEPIIKGHPSRKPVLIGLAMAGVPYYTDPVRAVGVGASVSYSQRDITKYIIPGNPTPMERLSSIVSLALQYHTVVEHDLRFCIKDVKIADPDWLPSMSVLYEIGYITESTHHFGDLLSFEERVEFYKEAARIERSRRNFTKEYPNWIVEEVSAMPTLNRLQYTKELKLDK